MEWLQLAALAIMQGLTEFLPISSSAHLILPSQLLGWPDQGLAFDVAVHVGSLTAVVVYFRRDLRDIVGAWLRQVGGGAATADSRLAWFLAAATVPVGLAGLLFGGFIETHLRSVAVIAGATIVFAVLLGWADKKGTRTGKMASLTLGAALLVGLAQALALIPGTSRSGITMTAGLALGLDRQSAARFSFLLAIPVIILSGVYKALQLTAAHAAPWGDLFLGAVLSALTAWCCIRFFLAIIDRIGMMPFVWYRLLLGAFLLVFLANGG